MSQPHLQWLMMMTGPRAAAEQRVLNDGAFMNLSKRPIYIPPRRPGLVHSLVHMVPFPPTLPFQPPAPCHRTIQRELGAPRSLRHTHHRHTYDTTRATRCHLPHHPEQKPDYLRDSQRGRQNAGHVPSSKTCPFPPTPHTPHTLYDPMASHTNMQHVANSFLTQALPDHMGHTRAHLRLPTD